MDIVFSPMREEAKIFPPTPTKFNLPEWYKNTDTLINNFEVTAKNLNDAKSPIPFTVKRCVPVMDYLTSGYTMFYPYDLLVSVVKTERGMEWYYRSAGNEEGVAVSHHDPRQYPITINGAPALALKFSCGWRIKTPAGYSSLIYPNFYQFENRVSMLPAIVDTDTFDHEILFLGQVDCSKAHDFKIEAGTPLVTIFPFKRDQWQMTVEKDLWERSKTKLAVYENMFFENIYRRFFHSKKAYK